MGGRSADDFAVALVVDEQSVGDEGEVGLGHLGDAVLESGVRGGEVGVEDAVDGTRKVGEAVVGEDGAAAVVEEE